jgi:hypothetical protein
MLSAFDFTMISATQSYPHHAAKELAADTKLSLHHSFQEAVLDNSDFPSSLSYICIMPIDCNTLYSVITQYIVLMTAEH